MTKTVHMLALGAVLLLATGLRVTRFDAMAPSNSDEASYLRHARFMATMARKLGGASVPVVAADAEGVWRYVRKDDWSAKPCWLHSGFMAGSMLLFGVGDAAGAGVNVVFSLLAVWLCYLAGRRIHGPAVGLISALFLAVSFYWLLYSRGMWAEVDGVAFVLLAFVLLLPAKKLPLWRNPGLESNWQRICNAFQHPTSNIQRPTPNVCPGSVGRWMLSVGCWMFIAGATAGLGVLCHYRLLFIIAPLGLVTIMLSSPRAWLPRLVLLAAGFFGVIALAAGLLRLVFVVSGVEAPFTGLIGALLERYLPGGSGVEQKGMQLSNVFPFGYYVLRNQGWAMFLLTIVGTAVSIVNLGYDRRNAAVLGMVIVPLGVLCLQVWVVARAASVLIPFVCLLGGLGAVTVWRLGEALTPPRRRLVQAAAAVLVCVAMAGNLRADARLIRNRMGHEEAARRLTEAGAGVVYVDPESSILYGWYAPQLPYRKLWELGAGPGSVLPRGAFAVFDGQKYHMYRPGVERVAKIERRVRAEAGAAHRVPNMTTLWPEFLLDGTQAHTLQDMLRSLRTADRGDIRSIRIYGRGVAGEG